MTKQAEITPEQISASEILAKTLYSAISPGTELAAWRGDKPLREGNIYPRLVGYCNVAQVRAKGAQVSGVEVGDFILTHQSHRSAFIADKSAVLTVIPKEMNLVWVSTTYLYHLGYSALLKANPGPGATVAIVGLGTLGFATLLLANALGYRVTGFSNQPTQLPDPLQQQITVHGKSIGPETESRFDLVINTSNDWQDHRLSMQLARKGGTIAVIGFPGRTQPTPDFNPLESQYFYDKQLTLTACGMVPNLDVPEHEIRFTIKRNCAFLLDLIHKGRLNAELLITEVLPWHELAQAYDKLENRSSGLRTCILDWTTHE